jgi:hypothetical protein
MSQAFPPRTLKILTLIECGIVLLNLFLVTRTQEPFLFGLGFDAVALPVTAAVMAAMSITNSEPENGVFVGLMMIALGLLRFSEASGSGLFVIVTYAACGFIFYRFTQSERFGFSKK